MSATTKTETYGSMNTTTKNKLLDKKKKKWGVKNTPAGNPWKREEDDDDEDDTPRRDLGSVIFDEKRRGKFKTRKDKRRISRGEDPYEY